jgi:hypothetical protein
MIEELLKAGGPNFLVPILVVVVGTALIKGLFGVHRSKSADRKDFLDFWSRRELQDDMWLEVAVRHLFGAYLPASLIRSLLQSPQVARSILEISESWNLLDMDDETKELRWKRERHSQANNRRRERWAFSTIYFVAMCVAVFFAIKAITTSIGGIPSWISWVYALFLGGFALWCLSKADALKTADTAVPRWLGLP